MSKLALEVVTIESPELIAILLSLLFVFGSLLSSRFAPPAHSYVLLHSGQSAAGTVMPLKTNADLRLPNPEVALLSPLSTSL